MENIDDRQDIINQTIEAAQHTNKGFEEAESYEDQMEKIQQAREQMKKLRGGASKNKIKKVLDNYRQISLSNYDIYDLLDDKVNVITYPELVNYDDINELFDPYDCFVLLYMTKQNYGHWCCCIKYPDRIEFFDPYGGDNLPDEELKNIPHHFRLESNQDIPHLSYLMYKSGYPIEYNHHRFQKYKTDTRTCGRHCAVRLMMKKKNLEYYNKYIRKLARILGIDLDELVTLLTMYINN